MGTNQVTVIMTCYNRKDKTVKCIETLLLGNPKYRLSFIVLDDNSTDGTVEAIKKLDNQITILHGDGNSYWGGGMYKAIDYYLATCKESSFVLLVNDDVAFYPNCIEQLIKRTDNTNAVVVGATCDEAGDFSYGAMKLIEKRKNDLYEQIRPSVKKVVCDTFNCNCVLIPNEVIRKVGNFDPMYRHALADLDYGFRIRKAGYNIYISDSYVGICNRNSSENTWRDTSLKRIERIRRKESIKGSPFRQWFYFMNKNFGFLSAVRYSISPYIRILFGK